MEEVEKWMENAQKDLTRAGIRLADKDYEDCAFHAHQAAEKALKALYIFKFKKLWKTHDLVGMLEKLNSDENLMKTCETLNRHYIETRYPTEAEYTETIAADAVESATRVMEWVKGKLKK